MTTPETRAQTARSETEARRMLRLVCGYHEPDDHGPGRCDDQDCETLCRWCGEEWPCDVAHMAAVVDHAMNGLAYERGEALRRADRAEARIQAVREMHGPWDEPGHRVCRVCTAPAEWEETYRAPYPCPTLRALDGDDA